jgi:hypothetical protein
MRRTNMAIAATETIPSSTSASRGQSSITKATGGLTTRRDRIIYWTTTGIVSAVMLFSIINFTFLQGFPFPEGGFVHLHLPNYFRVELTTAKTLGLLALLIPGVPAKIKEFAYFGFGLTLISASIAHFSVGDASRSVLFVLDPLVFFSLLTVSYVYFNKRSARRE